MQKHHGDRNELFSPRKRKTTTKTILLGRRREHAVKKIFLFLFLHSVLRASSSDGKQSLHLIIAALAQRAQLLEIHLKKIKLS